MIDTSTFQYADSRWADINDCLIKAGFEIHSPGTKVGECTSQYIVVKDDGSTKHLGVSTVDQLYAVMCYVPRMRYSDLEVMVRKVKAALRELEPMIVFNGNQTPSYYDDSVKAHMISIEYVNYRTMR